MNQILNNIIQEGLNNSKNHNHLEYKIENIIVGKSIYTMNSNDTIFNDMNICLIILRNGYGFSYFQSDIDFGSFERYVNQDIRELLKQNHNNYFKVALADALYSVNNLSTSQINYFRGTTKTKAVQRAKLITQDIKERSKVTLLGASSEIIEECTNKHTHLSVLDMEQSKVGLTFHGHIIQQANNHSYYLDQVKNSDYVIATGMILVSNTADVIFKLREYHKFKLILYMETGANLGGSLINQGADKVVSEYFPFFDFNGDTRYSIFET